MHIKKEKKKIIKHFRLKKNLLFLSFSVNASVCQEKSYHKKRTIYEEVLLLYLLSTNKKRKQQTLTKKKEKEKIKQISQQPQKRRSSELFFLFSGLIRKFFARKLLFYTTKHSTKAISAAPYRLTSLDHWKSLKHTAHAALPRRESIL